MHERFVFQSATSLKVVIDNWNIMSNHWLRYICYERVRSRLLVFMLSAFWHGFYGGYYVMFLTLSLLVESGLHVSAAHLLRQIRHVAVTERSRYCSVTYCD